MEDGLKMWFEDSHSAVLMYHINQPSLKKTENTAGNDENGRDVLECWCVLLKFTITANSLYKN